MLIYMFVYIYISSQITDRKRIALWMRRKRDVLGDRASTGRIAMLERITGCIFLRGVTAWHRPGHSISPAQAGGPKGATAISGSPAVEGVDG